MKFFLHWSCATVLGILSTAIGEAYGWWTGALACVAGVYVMVAQWYVGRYYE